MNKYIKKVPEPKIPYIFGPSEHKSVTPKFQNNFMQKEEIKYRPP